MQKLLITGECKERDKGDKKGALEDYNKAIEINPKLAKAFYNRGSVKYNLGDKQGAIQDFNKAIEINPKFAEAFNNRGNAKYDIGDKEGACLDWSKAGELGYENAYEMIKKYCK